MMTLLLAEGKKLLTTRLWWILLIPTVALSALGGLGAVLGSPLGITADEMAGGSTNAMAFVVAMAAVAFTSEFRHGLIASTLLAVPRRAQVVGAKLAIGAFVGVVYGAAAAGALAGAAYISAYVAGHKISPGHHVWQILAGGILAQALVGAFASLIGGAVRNQVAAVVGLLISLMVLGGLVTQLGLVFGVRGLPRFMIVNLTTSLEGGPHLPPGFHLTLPLYFGFWAALGVFGAYILVAAVGALWSISRDV